ncbi:MAG: QueT transporter family protein [Anaerovoracaceae bacterium]|jgi:uncharacterized membrane protein
MTTKRILQGAIIASIYAVLTILLAPISYGPMQVRVSEALTILPAMTPAGVPGLFVGCLVSNILGPYGIVDVVVGSTASLLAALASYKLRERPILVPLPPVIINGILIGGMLHFAYGVPNLPACMAWVALGQLLACYGLGYPLLKLLQRYEGVFR